MTAWDYDSATRRNGPLPALSRLLRQRGVVRAFVVRDLKVRYRRSALGVLWSVATPLLMMLVMTFAFSAAFGRAAPSFPAFVLSGILVWNFFANTVTVIVAEAAAGGDLSRRVSVPRAASAAATVITALIHLLIGVAVLIPIFALTGRPLGVPMATLPITITAMAAFTAGIALSVAAAALYFPDVAHIVPVLLPAWMFLTPVVYPAAIVPARWQWLLRANPMTTFVNAFRDPLYAGVVSSPSTFASMFAMALAALVAGWCLFTYSAHDNAHRG
jgi:ABC-type polysaccharide/polyol phosphate export permease